MMLKVQQCVSDGAQPGSAVLEVARVTLAMLRGHHRAIPCTIQRLTELHPVELGAPYCTVD